MPDRVTERGTTKPAGGDMNRNEGRLEKSEQMLTKYAETRKNEGRRDTRTNVEVGGKTRNEDKKRYQDQCRGMQNSGYGLVRGGSYVEGPCRILGHMRPGAIIES